MRVGLPGVAGPVALAVSRALPRGLSWLAGWRLRSPARASRR